MSNQTRNVGTVSRGIRCPIIREGDDLGAIVAESVLAAAESDISTFLAYSLRSSTDSAAHASETIIGIRTSSGI